MEEHLKKMAEEYEKNHLHKKGYKFLLNALTDDVNLIHYKSEIRNVDTLPKSMTSKLERALIELCVKNRTAKALREKAINCIIGDNIHSVSLNRYEEEAKIILNYLESQGYIKRDGDYIVIGRELRENLDLPIEDETKEEKCHEKVSEIKNGMKSIEIILNEGLIIKENNKIDERLEKKEYVQIEEKPMEKEERISPRNHFIFRRYHAIMLGVSFLIGLNYLATSKPVKKFAENTYNCWKETAKNFAKNAKEIPSLIQGYHDEKTRESIERKNE